ncbi:TolB family protein [Alkaliphilus transvaalensis]|uniref:TolB family protein n=1 Tax=Alkaliphilus transvaalensis TaxID=114628 RepID=UPI0004793F35|nr:WD40 repeat domain-containing protein [Alkaliphilus transvaalensis]
MKNIKFLKLILMIGLLLVLTACSKETGKTISVVDDEGNGAGEMDITVVKIDRYDNVAMTDWLNKNTLIVSKENTSLDKMSLLELSDSHPRSLYLYNINNREYQLLKEANNVHLGGATLSPDKKNLLYYEYTLGDPAYYVMNMDTLDTFGIRGTNIAGAMSAKWGDNESVVGAAYSGGAYLANLTGEITVVDEIKEESLFIVEKINNNFYYNTNSDETLWRLDMSTKEKVSLDLSHVYGVLPSPDGNQMLVLQNIGAKKILTLSDNGGEIKKIIAEGAELGGVSWSPDQRMITYNLKDDVNNKIVEGFYIYDMLTGKATQIVEDIQYMSISWSPSGEELVYTEWDGTKYNSSIVYLEIR